jgi:predicted transcriptional regulator
MKNNLTIIKDAIASHSQFSPNQKEIMCLLLDLAIDGEVITNVNDIQKLSKSTRATISTAIAFLNKYGIITNSNVNGKKFTGCYINQDKIDEILLHYNKKKNLIKK